MSQQNIWNKAQSIIWYDLETTGINKAFDQPLQFAAIKTTPDLDIIETINLEINLTADVVPSPDALLVHKIPVQNREKGISQHIAIEQIHQILNQPNSINCGYNSLRFDDEFLRFCFFRHLYHPYTHQYSNGCKRFDLYPAIVYYYLFSPETLSWPTVNNRVSLKLENLATANNIAIKGEAHDALVDVHMTIDLAKKMMTNSEAWHTVINFFDKNHDIQTSSQLPIIEAGKKPHCYGLLLDTSFGFAQNFSSLCLSLGRHKQFKNQSIWLKLDTHQLSSFDSEETTYPAIVKKKWGEPPFLLHPDNAQSLKNYEKKQAIVEENIQWIQQNPDRFDSIADYYTQQTYSAQSDVDLDAQLYDTPFFTELEEQICNQFHVALPKAKANLVSELSHPTLKQQAIRYMWRYHPEALALIKDEQALDYQKKIYDIDRKPIIDHLGQAKLTPAACLERIEQIIHEQSLTTLEKERLRELEVYIYDHFILPLEDNES